MSDNIVNFPKKDIEKNKLSYLTEDMQKILKSVDGDYGILLIRKKDNTISVLEGYPTTQQVVNLCSVAIYDALSIEYRSDEPTHPHSS